MITKNDCYSYIVGLWIGDGCRTDNVYRLALTNIEQGNKIKQILKKYFNVKNIGVKKVDTYCELRVLKTKKFVNILREKIKDGRLWEEIKINPFPFIAGFIDTDGCFLWSDLKSDKNGLNIEISNTNIEWLKFTQNLLRENNIHSIIEEQNFTNVNKKGEIWVVDRFIPISRLKKQYELNIYQKPSVYILSKKIKQFMTKKYVIERLDKFVNNYEKLRLNGFIPIIEVFKSLQGEGTLIGTPQIFVRVSGCNLRCHDCDTKESWKRNDKLKITVRKLIHLIKQHDCKSVCLTGGEITLYSYGIAFLIAYLKSEGYFVNVQTNGIKFEPSIFNIVDKVCMDMKVESNKNFIKLLRPEKDEIKVLVGNQKDYNYAKQIHNITLKNNIDLILQVRNDVGKNNQEDLLNKYKWLVEKTLNDNKFIKEHLIILPQLHVLIWGNKKGV
jgi:7-carboxy-7-deazaguanine synthase